MPIFKSLFAISTLSVDMELNAVREKQLPERNRNSPVYSKCNLHLMLSDTKLNFTAPRTVLATEKKKYMYLKSGKINTKLTSLVTSGGSVVCGRVGHRIYQGGGKERRLYFTPNIDAVLNSVMMRIFLWKKNSMK